MKNALLSESWYLEVYHIFENYGSGSVKLNVVKTIVKVITFTM
ncbi:MAG: hypothetical protein V8Q58_09355 [Anaerobutyricum hallii]